MAAWGGITFEVVGGIFLIIGALTPLIGLGVLVAQVLTICWTNYYRGPDLVGIDGTYNGGFEYNVALAVLGLLFRGVRRRRGLAGPGAVSPSTTRDRRHLRAVGG